MENEDIVHVLLNKPFSTFSYREKVSMKTTGRPLPKIQVTKPSGKTAAVNANYYLLLLCEILMAHWYHY